MFIGTAGFVSSQQSPISPVTVTLDVETGIRLVDNYQLTDPATDTTMLFENKLGLGAVWENDINRFSVGVGGNLQFTKVEGAGSDWDVDNHFASVGYVRQGATGNLSTRYNYNSASLLDSVDTLVELEELRDEDLVLDSGRRNTQRFDLDWELNTAGAVGYRVGAGWQDTSYSDTTDASLVDSERRNLSVAALLRLTQLAAGELEFSRTEFLEEDAAQTDRTTDTVEFRLDYVVTPIWTLDASIGHRKIETLARSTGALSEETGTIGSLGINREIPSGMVRLGIGTDVSTSGRRSNVTLSFDGSRLSSEYDVAIGAVRNPNGDNNAFGRLNYAHDLPTGKIGFGISQSYATDDDGDDTATTRANIFFDYEINDVSGLGFTFSHSEVENEDTGSDSVVQTASATYSRSITEDWRMTTGLKHTRRDQTASDVSSSEVFLKLKRSFVFKP